MTQLDKLINHINTRLATAGLSLSEYGKTEVATRFSKPEAEGGYSSHWKNL